METRVSQTDADALSFGALLQRFRLQAGFTQERLAERAGVSVRGLSDLERGVNAAPRRDTLSLLLDALELLPAQRSELLRAAQRPRHPPLHPVATVSPSGLPHIADLLIGRDTDLVRVATLLHDQTVRLLTIIGPGGTGKTRLAIAAGHQLAATGRAVIWVPLASARSAGSALAALAAALGLEVHGSIPLTDLLARSLASRQVKLILDNVEQIPDLAQELGRLLAATPDLSILATSRAPLRLHGERRYQLDPLSVSTDHEAHVRESVFTSPAAELFLRRAAEIDANLALSDDSVAAIQAICVRLDGLPLAIELAAARSAVLPPAALQERLNQALPLLTMGSIDAPDRQRTLRKAIAWSYDLLPQDTQEVFRRFGVFVGGFTLSAAEHVCELSSSKSVIDHLQLLMEQSLVRAVSNTDPPRYMLLETIREFALEQLDDAEEAMATHEAHAQWIYDHVRDQYVRMFTLDDVRAFSILDTESANSRLAIATFMRTPGGAERAAEISHWLSPWWQLRAKSSEVLPQIDELLARHEELRPGVLANLLVSASTFRNERGEDTAELMAREAVKILEEQKDSGEPDFMSLARARFYLADTLSDPAERRRHYEIGLEYAQRINLELMEAFLLGALCLAWGELGQADEAIRAGPQAIALQKVLGGRIGTGQAHSQLGHALRLLNRHIDALPYLSTAFRNFWEIGAIGWTAQSLEGIGACAAHAGHSERAAWLIGAASQLRLRSGWSVDLELFGRTPETQRSIIEALGDQAFVDLQTAGAAATWQEIHDMVLGEALVPEAFSR